MAQSVPCACPSPPPSVSTPLTCLQGFSVVPKPPPTAPPTQGGCRGRGPANKIVKGSEGFGVAPTNVGGTGAGQWGPPLGPSYLGPPPPTWLV